jgi:hypothetical protein
MTGVVLTDARESAEERRTLPNFNASLNQTLTVR